MLYLVIVGAGLALGIWPYVHRYGSVKSIRHKIRAGTVTVDCPDGHVLELSSPHEMEVYVTVGVLHATYRQILYGSYFPSRWDRHFRLIICTQIETKGDGT